MGPFPAGRGMVPFQLDRATLVLSLPGTMRGEHVHRQTERHLLMTNGANHKYGFSLNVSSTDMSERPT